MFKRPEPRIFPTHEGRVAVVTGASQGIGQIFCRQLAERGAQVIGVARGDQSETAAMVEAAGGTFVAVRADMASQQDIKAVAETVQDRFGRCDILINNAAIYDPIGWDEIDFQRWREIHAVNLDGPFLLCKALVPMMSANGYGRIVNVVSGAVAMPMDVYFAYRSAKMGLIGLTRALASLGERGIVANCVTPGLTRTKGAVEANAGDEGLFDMVRSMQTIKVDVLPEDLGHTVMFLTSEEAYWFNGQALPIDGGTIFGLP